MHGPSREDLLSAAGAGSSYQGRSLRTFSNDRPSQLRKSDKKKQVIKFEIHIDSAIGTQEIEIYDRKLISENVDRFALKYGIKSKTKINKLKKYIKSQFKQKQEEQNDIS